LIRIGTKKAASLEAASFLRVWEAIFSFYAFL
jgi:hypothetical protein